MIAKHAAITNASHVNQLEAQRFKVAARVFRDDRRLYRRAKRNHVGGAEINFKRTAMPALRLASKMGLLKDMMLFDIHRYRLALPGQKTRPIVEVAPEGEVKQKLCVARNLRDLRPTLSGASVGYHNEENTYIPGLVMRQWTEKNLKKLRDLCAHYKLELVEFDYEEAKKRVPVKRVKVEDKYFCLEDCKHGHFHGEPSCSEPGYYLTTWQRDEEPRLPFGEHLLGLREKYPNTVLITQKGQEEKLKKLGVRNLAEVAAERLVKLTKVREVVYGETIRHGRMFITGNIYNGSVADLALKLSKMDMRLAKLLFPDRATPGELHREAALLWDFLSEVQSLTEETKPIVDTARAGMFKACDMMFKARSPSAIDKQFEYLEVLCGANVTYRDRYSYLPASRQAADLIETVKFLQRRTSQSKLTSRQTPANSAEIAHKEAA
jgi:hypothetical protein